MTTQKYGMLNKTEYAALQIISIRPLQLFSQLTTVLNEDEELSALKVRSSKKCSRPSSHTISGFKENEQSI